MSEPAIKLDNRLAYNYKEAADLVGVSEWTIGRLVRDGKLPAARFGRLKRIPHDALVSYLNQQGTTTEALAPCHTSAKTRRSGGSVTPTAAAKELEKLLTQPTGGKQRR